MRHYGFFVYSVTGDLIYAIGPIIQWSPSRDLQHLMAAEDQLQCHNGRLNILLFLVEAHWCAIEIDRRTEPVSRSPHSMADRAPYHGHSRGVSNPADPITPNAGDAG